MWMKSTRNSFHPYKTAGRCENLLAIKAHLFKLIEYDSFMKIIETPREVQELCEQWRCDKETIGFVPTMGALHEGHLALFRRARDENSKIVASIFVNPIQFRAGEDLEKYPRPFERDCKLLQDLGCDIVFAPSREAMYGNDGDSQTFVEVEGLSTRWEGEVRPGHFRGVSTVVAKLFNIVRSQRAYFGEKDFQQLQIIKRMTRDLNFDVQIVACPTIRERDGLALSSRNVYLNAEERAAAPAIFRALSVGQSAACKGQRNAGELLQLMHSVLAKEPLLQQEYFAIVDCDSLQSLEELQIQKPARAIVAARAGSTRLIDNIELLAL
jgi:pantoate--beta-alanine ligase